MKLNHKLDATVATVSPAEVVDKKQLKLFVRQHAVAVRVVPALHQSRACNNAEVNITFRCTS